MTHHLISKAPNSLLALPGALLSGIFIYILLSYLLIPPNVAFPLSSTISVVIFGLTTYYINAKDREIEIKTNGQIRVTDQGSHSDIRFDGLKSMTPVIFLSIYVICLFVAVFLSDINKEIFVSWNEFHSLDVLKLLAAIGLSFFLPGYVIVGILNGQNKFGPLPKVLLSYFFSMLISGLVGYILTFLGFNIWTIKLTLVGIYLALLVAYIIQNFFLLNRVIHLNFLSSQGKYDKSNGRALLSLGRRKILPSILVVIGLISWVVLTSYYLYNGTIIGDQWFHHGRSLDFISGSFKELATYGLDETYPPFLSAILGSFFSLSGVPSVNAYVSINFLNFMPVIAFYYFFTRWVRGNNRRAALLACSLFVLSSGFGWAEVVHVALTEPPIASQISSLEILDEIGRKTFDIRLPSTFFNVGNPEGTTALIIIAIPAGFTFLGLIKEKIQSSRLKLIVILTGISILGILSHDEFFLFVIVVSIAPLIFQLNNKGSYHSTIYISILLAISVVYLVDSIYSVKYYSSREIFGLPLLYLVFFFVILCWILDITVHLRLLANFKNSVKKKLKFHFGSYPYTKIKKGLFISIAVACVFLYLLTFIVWGTLSLEQIYEHSTLASRGQKIIPWYLYPMKLGVTGLLGFAFILSYLFKKFEKELFIFGLIAVIALFAGPYYDEHRFGKYITACMAAYASLLIYKLIASMKRSRPWFVVRGLLIGLIISSSSLSIVLYHGYTALGLENPSFTPFYRIMGTRFFPSEQDLSLHRFVFNNLYRDPTKDYFAIPSNEYGEHSGLKAQLLGFSGIPNTKLWQSPLTLNASTLEVLYYLINHSDVRYIILPKNSLYNNDQTEMNLKEPVKFALENFQKVYESDGYIVLSVPPLSPPSLGSNISIVYPKHLLPSPLSHEDTLPFDNVTFKKFSASENVKNSNDETTDNRAIVLKNTNKKNTIWSNTIPNNNSVNYIETSFRIIDDKDNNKRYNAGIVWNDTQKEYYLSANNDSFSLEEKSNSNQSERRTLTQTLEIKRDSEWYSVRIASLKDDTNIYINEIPIFQSQKKNAENVSISEVGIRSYRTEAEFEPIKIGHITEPCKGCLERQTYYQQYYPISMFALSQDEYETFSQGDFSALSKKNVLLTSDPSEIGDNLDTYMDFVESGRTIVVFDTDTNQRGIFETLFSVKPGNKINFDSISQPGLESTQVSGNATDLKLADTKNVTVNAFYSKDNNSVAPFVMERSYDNGGRVIYVNAEGYFDAIARSPKMFFPTLAEIPKIIGIPVDTFAREHVPDIQSATRFTGDLKIVGNTSINSSSILFPTDTSQPYGFYADDAYIQNLRDDNKTMGHEGDSTHFRDVIVNELSLSGKYGVTINSAGVSYLPTISSSKPDYFSIILPAGSNLSINIEEGEGTGVFMVGNNSHSFHILDGGELNLQGIESVGRQDSVSVLLKEPRININGSAAFRNIISDVVSVPSGEEGKVNGTMTLRLSYLDQNDENTRRGENIQFVTYLNDIRVKKEVSPRGDSLGIKLPGDVSETSEIQASWMQVIITNSSLIALVIMILVIVTICVIYYSWIRSKIRIIRSNRKK